MADVLGIAIVYLIAIIVFGIPSYIIYWKLYNKAGQAGWKSIIPFYSLYVMGVIAKEPNAAVVAVAASAAYSVLSALNIKALAIVLFVAILAYVGFGLYVLSKFIQQYDAGIGKWILFIFFPYIGVFLVGSVNYKGGATSLQSPTMPISPAAPTTAPTASPITASPTPPSQPVNSAQPPAAPTPSSDDSTPPQPPASSSSL